MWIALVTCLLTTASEPDARLERHELETMAMGMRFRIALYARSPEAADQAAHAAFERVRAIDRIFSDYDPGSEAMRLCARTGCKAPIPVSEELAGVLARSLRFSALSGGAFDVTVGPVVQLWRAARRSGRLPTKEALAAARTRVGWDLVHLDTEAGTVVLSRPGMRLDFGGIAKGHALDEALAALRARGIRRALVSAGGDVVVAAPPPGRPGWRIGIAPLDDPDRIPDEHVLLRDAAVATSGDAYQHLVQGGRRHSHIIDPRTGAALTTPSSVTVIAADGLTADALATTLSVLEPPEGIALLASFPGAATRIVRREPDGIRAQESAAFRDFEVP